MAAHGSCGTNLSEVLTFCWIAQEIGVSRSLNGVANAQFDLCVRRGFVRHGQITHQRWQCSDCVFFATLSKCHIQTMSTLCLALHKNSNHRVYDIRVYLVACELTNNNRKK
jgi:hypothetical protein